MRVSKAVKRARRRTWGLAALGALVWCGATASWSAERSHTVPYVPSAAHSGVSGLVRIENRSGREGEVRLVAVDDDGRRHEGGAVELAPKGAVQFGSGDLEWGNAELGLPGTGAGEGDWRLELSTDLDVEVRAYAVTAGFATVLDDVAPGTRSGYRVMLFNPGGNLERESLLRLANVAGERASVTVRGRDDAGAPGGEVRLELPAGGARTYTSWELETGRGAGHEGPGLGDGAGKWRLRVESDRELFVVHLMRNRHGAVWSLPSAWSRGPGTHRVPLFPSASDGRGREGVLRLLNGSAESGAVRIEAFDGTGREYQALELTLAAGRAAHVNSRDLEDGNARKGLRGGTGAGEGDWRVEVTSGLDLEVQGLVRSAGGLLQTMRGTTGRERQEGGMRYEVPLFHGAGHEGQESALQLLNEGGGEARVRVHVLDAAGERSTAAVLSLATGSALRLGPEAIEGRESDGRPGGMGAWRLVVDSDREIEVLSLGVGPGGSLADLSRTGPPAGSGRRTEVIDTTAETPDLWVRASAREAAVPPGGRFRLRATVGNGGGGGSPATTLRYHRSADAAVTPADAELDEEDVPALAAGAGGTWSLEQTAPTRAGTYHYGACVDAVAGETDTSNNCSAVAVTVREPPERPDLVVTARASAAVLAPGESFELEAVVHNAGDEDGTATTLRYLRSADATIAASDAELGTAAVPALEAAHSSAHALRLVAPRAAGVYYYGACADAVPDEWSTVNNCSRAVAVTVADLDLAVSASSSEVGREPGCNPRDPAMGISAVVRNAGGTDAPGTMLRFYRSSDATVSADDVELGSVAVPTLAASATWAHTLESDLVTGTHHYYACVDPPATETRTSNNCSVPQRMTTSAPSPGDLAVTYFQVVDKDWYFSYVVETRNVGEGLVTGHWQRVYRSSDRTFTPEDPVVGALDHTKPPDSGCYLCELGGGCGLRAAVSGSKLRGTHYYRACAEEIEPEDANSENDCSEIVEVVAP